jgi:hypothetical protein
MSDLTFKMTDYVNHPSFVSMEEGDQKFVVNMKCSKNEHGRWMTIDNRIMPDEFYSVSFFKNYGHHR